MTNTSVVRLWWLGVLTVAVSAWLPSGAALAQQRMFSTRFEGSDTWVAIGVVNGSVTIVERRASDGACQTQLVTDGSALAGTTGFYAGSGRNWVRTFAGNASGSLCGLSVGPIANTNTWFAVFGGAGNDSIIASEISDDTGDDGDDFIVADGSYTGLFGAGGNDWVIQTDQRGRAAFLRGGSGDDRLCDLADGSRLEGGDGFDLGWNGVGGDKGIEGALSGEDCQQALLSFYVSFPF